MPLVFKIVGYTADKKQHEIKDPFNGPINLRLLYELYKVWGLSEDEIHNIKFITDSEQIKNPDKNFNVSENEDRVIFVFTSNIDVRQKLREIFIREGTEVQLNTESSDINDATEKTKTVTIQLPNKEPDPEICEPMIQSIKVDPIPVLTPEIINVMNIKSISLFGDQDFRNLISIYIRKPELFSVVGKYVQNGNVIEESLGPLKTLDMLSSEEITNYKKLCTEIKNLGINFDDDIIITRLIKYSGHLNLTVRSLLCESAVNTNTCFF